MSPQSAVTIECLLLSKTSYCDAKFFQVFGINTVTKPQNSATLERINFWSNVFFFLNYTKRFKQPIRN